jgi:delta 1-pyrroline-5-carboxylate dehydrogenase
MLTGAIAELQVGDPLDYATDIGPVIDEDSQTILEAHKLDMRRRALPENRLLDHEHAEMTRGARHEVLRPLPHEIPAQVREAYEKGRRPLARQRPSRFRVS